MNSMGAASSDTVMAMAGSPKIPLSQPKRRGTPELAFTEGQPTKKAPRREDVGQYRFAWLGFPVDQRLRVFGLCGSHGIGLMGPMRPMVFRAIAQWPTARSTKKARPRFRDRAFLGRRGYAAAPAISGSASNVGAGVSTGFPASVFWTPWASATLAPTHWSTLSPMAASSFSTVLPMAR
jgi:hypothetical protein